MSIRSNAKEKNDIFDDRQLDDTGTPGLEVVYWEASSTFGPFSRILTHGGVEGDGCLGFYVTDAQSIQEAGEIGITPTPCLNRFNGPCSSVPAGEKRKRQRGG
jgi:hypothetical protein